jgi:hypothetical protein
LNFSNAKENLEFENGIAIGTFWAASCIQDSLRTRQFIKGIEMAIKEMQAEGKQPLIFYAGTGPFASLLLPIILRYPELRYQLLEINADSLAILKHIFETLHLTEMNVEFIHGNATSYSFNKENALPDIIVSETMQNALEQEQQVLVFDNLSRQTPPDCAFIPETIEIFIGSCNQANIIKTNATDFFEKHSKIFEVSRNALEAKNWQKSVTTNELIFPQVKSKLQQRNDQNIDHLFLLTEITTYNSLSLTLNESGLTAPKNIGSMLNEEEKELTIFSTYQLSPRPTFEIKMVET